MGVSTISLGLGLGGGKAATSSGRLAGGGAFVNQYSVSFDGTDDFMSVPSNASLNTSGDWSFSCWLYADDLSQFKALGARRTGGNSWQISVNASSSLDLYLFSAASAQFQSNSTLSTGQWFHVAFTVAVGVTDGVKMYINGTVQSNTGTTSTSSNNANYGMTFGDNTRSRFWNGELDEIAMFHTALSASDIATLRGGASAGTLGLPADISSLNPVAWWRMGDGTEAGSGTTVYDMSANSNNGTLYNIESPNGFVTTVPS